MDMNEQLIKTLGQLIGPKQIEAAFSGIANKLMQYNKKFPAKETEQNVLMLFEQNGKMFISACTLDESIEIPQHETSLLSEKLVQILKSE